MTEKTENRLIALAYVFYGFFVVSSIIAINLY